VTIGKGKRPRDPNQLAKWIVDRSTSDDPEPKQEPAPIPTPPVNTSPLWKSKLTQYLLQRHLDKDYAQA